MKIIEADHERRYEIPGVPGLARKPVDIDSTKTGFEHLRSLRIYRFEAGVSVDGHAEGDEVFVVVLSGSIEMKIGWEDTSPGAFGTFHLAAPDGARTAPFVAYLPPHSVYRLTPHTSADIAYVRATPTGAKLPAVFGEGAIAAEDTGLLLEEMSHAEKLRLRIYSLQSRSEKVRIEIGGGETLVHLQGAPEIKAEILSELHGRSSELRAWQTASLERDEPAELLLQKGMDALAFIVQAS